MDYQQINVISQRSYRWKKSKYNHDTEKYQLLAVKIDININHAYDLLSSSTSGQMSCLFRLVYLFLSQMRGYCALE